ncbi:MAG: YceI family protein [Pseudorhodobacter sp.]
MIRRMFAATAAVLAMPATLPVLAQDFGEPPTGAYQMDLGHTRLLFRVDHLGFSNYTALFTDVSAELGFDPDAPAAMTLSARVVTASLETHYPDPAVPFNAILTGPDFLDAGNFPEATFVSTDITLTGDREADVTGDLTLRGITRPVTLAVRYNGGYGDFPMDLGARIGFSATGTFKRSDFGMGYGLPAAGTVFGVSDRVEIVIEAEFVRPR